MYDDWLFHAISYLCTGKHFLGLLHGCFEILLDYDFLEQRLLQNRKEQITGMSNHIVRVMLSSSEQNVIKSLT